MAYYGYYRGLLVLAGLSCCRMSSTCSFLSLWYGGHVARRLRLRILRWSRTRRLGFCLTSIDWCRNQWRWIYESQ